MSALAVDASVAAKLILPEEFSEQAIALFEDAVRDGTRSFAPYLLPVEETSTIRRHMRRERLTLRQALEMLEDFLAQPVELVDDQAFHRRALELTESYGIGAHDAHYLAVAEAIGCELWIADDRLRTALGGRVPFVRWTGDYASAGRPT